MKRPSLAKTTSNSGPMEEHEKLADGPVAISVAMLVFPSASKVAAYSFVESRPSAKVTMPDPALVIAVARHAGFTEADEIVEMAVHPVERFHDDVLMTKGEVTPEFSVHRMTMLPAEL